MKKKFVLIFFLSLCSVVTFAQDVSRPFKLQYKFNNDGEDVHEEMDFASLGDAFYKIRDEASLGDITNVKITLMDDFIKDDSYSDDISLNSNDVVVTIDLKSKEKQIQGGKYYFYVGNYSTIIINGDNSNTNINAHFYSGETGHLVIDGGNYTNKLDYASIIGCRSGDGITIKSGRFKSEITPAIENNDSYGPINIPSTRFMYEIDVNGNEIEPPISQYFNDDGYLVNGSGNVVYEFIVHGVLTPYAELSSDGKTLTFKYDKYMPETNAWEVKSYDDIMEEVNNGGDYDAYYPDWTYYCEDITTVVFDASFSNYRPTSCYRWFLNCFRLTTFEDLTNFITDNVKDMNEMFSTCVDLPSIDLSTFNTSNVEVMAGMFEDCYVLENLDLSSFNLSKVEDMSSMFYNCQALTNITFDKASRTSSLEYIGDMFNSCISLTILDLRSFSTEKLLFTNSAFASCENLTTIIVPDDWDNSNFMEQYDDGPRGGWVDILPFEGSENIVGGNGTQWEENATVKGYLRIDGKDGKPGLLTTLPYTIKYVEEDDKEASYEGLPTEYYLYDENIATLKDYSKDPIIIPSPSKKGYVFLGWSEGLNTGLTAVAKEVKIDPATDRCNRIYKANWKKRITAEVADKASYPDPERLELYCNGKDKTISLPYKITYGRAIGFKLTLRNTSFVITGDLTNEDTLFIKVMDDITSGEYEGELEFLGTYNPETNPNGDPDSDPYPVKITVNLVQNVAVQLYTDMLIADNHSGVYSAYQWYRDGEPIQGAIEQYYVEPQFDYNKSYTVKLSGNGEDIMSCPVRWLSTAKNLNSSVKVYPNPAKQNELFTLEILDYDSEQSYDIVIFTANGTLAKKISNVEKKTSVSLPAGIYSGSLISGDDKKGFKLIVK